MYALDTKICLQFLFFISIQYYISQTFYLLCEDIYLHINYYIFIFILWFDLKKLLTSKLSTQRHLAELETWPHLLNGSQQILTNMNKVNHNLCRNVIQLFPQNIIRQSTQTILSTLVQLWKKFPKINPLATRFSKYIFIKTF